MDSIQSDHSTPNSNEVKLIIDNSLLGLEKRMTESIRKELSDQNKTYLDKLLAMNTELTSIKIKQERFDERLKGFKVIVTTASAASAVLSGLVGFYIGQITKGAGS